MIPSPLRLLNRRVVWSATSDAEFPFEAALEGNRLTIRINDFPAESLYTLLINGEPVLDLEEWPRDWQRPPRPGVGA